MLCEVTSAKHAVLYEVTSAKHAVLYEVTSAKHAWVSFEKIWMGQMGKLGEKIEEYFCTDCIHFLWLV